MKNEIPSAIARVCILETLFLGVSTAKILDFFLGVKGFDYPEIDIARKADISARQVSRSLPLLIEQGLISQTRISGRSKMYKLNTESKTVKHLQNLVYYLAEPKLGKKAKVEKEESQEQMVDPLKVKT